MKKIKNKIINFKKQLTNFIKDTRGSDDKNAGSAMSIIIAVVIGFLLLTSLYGFFNGQFLPAVFEKIMEALNYSN